MALPRKQASDQADWLTALASAQADPRTPERASELVEKAAADVRARLGLFGRKPAYGWSGGKDSLVLEVVCAAAGIDDGVLVISDLEYPAFLAWATDNMPHGLSVEVRPWDLSWLAKHPEMLFPTTSAVASRWFSGVQHWGQRRYVARRSVDVLLMGRRRSDGNYCGKGSDAYRDKAGFVRWSPIAHWSHEDVLTVLAGYSIGLPPCYTWPRGFRVGTGSWAARQWCPTPAEGWAEVYSIDPTVVEGAASMIPSAAVFLAQAP